MFMFGRIRLYAIGVASGFLALLAIYWQARRAGAAAAKAAANEAKWDDLAKAKKTEDEVNALDDDALRGRSAKWVRRK